jgi:small subunit ribosomal protein S16
MLMMRLQRIGRKNSPSYRVLVVDSRQSVKSNKFVDQLGSYDPKAGVYTIDGEKAKHWLSKGVKASPTVHNMLVSKGVIKADKITVQAPRKEKADESALSSGGSEPAPEAEAPAAEAAAEAPAA